MTYRTLYKLFKFKRQGASLVNVCVFFLAATMIMAQVFFFSTTTSETLAEEAKSVERRFSMGQKLQLAFKILQGNDISSDDVSPDKISFYTPQTAATGNFKSFYPTACAWSNDKDVKDIYIYNLNYTLFERDYANVDDSQKWNEAAKTPHKLIFPPMGAGHFLVRVLAPEQRHGKKLMYQVLVKRTGSTPYTVQPLTFQEVWYE